MKLLIWALVILILLVIYIPVSTIISTELGKTRVLAYPKISQSDLETGDLLYARLGMWSGLIPGYWSHSGIVYDQENGTILVAESRAGQVMKITTLEDFKSRITLLSVGKGQGLSSEEKRVVKDWLYSRQGMAFDYMYPLKQEDSQSYYCSELIWATYKQIEIETDLNPGFSLSYAFGVSPQELFDNGLFEKRNLLD